MSSYRDIQRERLFYLEFLALFLGRVSRKDLVSRFGISEPAATKDLTIYTELAPEVLRYDLKQKCYVFSGGKPYFAHDIDQALYSLAGERAIAIDTEHAKRLPSWTNSSIKRKMPLSLVATITRCIYQHRKITAEYGSLSTGSKARTLSPVALVHDGLRWHIRCYAHEHQEFRDYNLARFSAAIEGDLSDVSLDQDPEWNNEVCLKLIAHPKAEHPETIRMDYDIADDAKDVTLKVCLVGYFLRHWHIDCSDTADGNPKAHQLFLNNKQELLDQGVSQWAFKP
jgi:hypothetical protein